MYTNVFESLDTVHELITVTDDPCRRTCLKKEQWSTSDSAGLWGSRRRGLHYCKLTGLRTAACRLRPASVSRHWLPPLFLPVCEDAEVVWPTLHCPADKPLPRRSPQSRSASKPVLLSGQHRGRTPTKQQPTQGEEPHGPARTPTARTHTDRLTTPSGRSHVLRQRLRSSSRRRMERARAIDDMPGSSK